MEGASKVQHMSAQSSSLEGLLSAYQAQRRQTGAALEDGGELAATFASSLYAPGRGDQG